MYRFKIRCQVSGQPMTKVVTAKDVLEAFNKAMDDFPAKLVDTEKVQIVGYVRECFK